MRQDWSTAAPALERVAREFPSQSAAAYDAQLVRQFNAGHEAAFVEIVDRFRKRIFATAFALVHNHADADDVTQDTFIRAHRGLAHFRGESSLATWLHRIATNLSRNHYWYFVRRSRHTTLSLDAPMTDEGHATVADVLVTGEPSPAHVAASDEFSALILVCMDHLPPPQRDILTLRNGLDQTYAEIAAALGIKVGTVKSRIARARDSLRQLIADACPEFAPAALLAEWFEPNRAASRCKTTANWRAS